MFGFTNENRTLDPLNNTFVDFIPYNLSTGEVLNRSDDFELRHCSQEEINALIPPSK